jgi:hypothetical protein
MNDGPTFEVFTPLGFRVRTTSSYWELIVNVKHPAMYGREGDVEEALEYPDEIRRSRSDPDVYLFYRLERPDRWICVVVKRLDGDGFVITAYPTDTIKEGQRVWTR